MTTPETEAAIESLADKAKRLGNEAFAAKKYDEAISFYTEAIKHDPENAIYYSNRSACYAFQAKWQAALEDALICIAKDPKFIKGYFRLSTAQIELQKFEEADATISVALKIDPDNEPLLKQKRIVKQKRAALAAKAAEKKSVKQLDEAQIKELMELQDQMNANLKDLRTVQSRLAGCQREARATQATMHQISDLDESVPLYRAVGKAFVLAPRNTVESKLESDIETSTRNQRDYTDRIEYLERRIASNRQNMKDLTAGY